MAEYNGYPNYETWRIACDVLIDRADYLIKDGVRFDTVGELADHFRDEIESLIDDDGGNGFAVNLANSFISDVDWLHIADGFEEELTRENWIECEECGNMFPGEETAELASGTYCHSCAEDVLTSSA